MSFVPRSLLLFVGGGVMGFASMMNAACGSDTHASPAASAPLASGQMTIATQSEWFEQEGVESPLPELDHGKLSIDLEANVIVLDYQDQLGGPVRVTFEGRAAPGGAGEGGG